MSASAAWLLTLHSAINQIFLIKPKATTCDESVAILIPARNEERNIEDCVNSAIAQTGLSNFSVTVLSDNSKDQTFAIASRIFHPALRVTTSREEPPDGWIGKQWACHRLAEQAHADYLVFIDADVVLEPHAVASTISAMRQHQLQCASSYPRQTSQSTLANIVQPLLQWSWLTTVPLGIARRFQNPVFAVANGQFIACETSAYRMVNGHAAVRREVLEDIELARAFMRGGYRASVLDGTALATCMMYRKDSDLLNGYSKSLWQAFQGLKGTLSANGLLFFAYVVPFLGLFTTQWRIALLGYAAGVLGRMISAHRFRAPLFPDVFIHPIAICAFHMLNVLSWIRHNRGTNTWKGRHLP